MKQEFNPDCNKCKKFWMMRCDKNRPKCRKFVRMNNYAK